MGLWLAQQTHDLVKQGWSFSFENLATIIELKWWCSDLDITIFLQDA